MQCIQNRRKTEAMNSNFAAQVNSAVVKVMSSCVSSHTDEKTFLTTIFSLHLFVSDVKSSQWSTWLKKHSDVFSAEISRT